MPEIQPDDIGIFERAKQKLHMGDAVSASQSWFNLCKITIKDIHKVLQDKDEWEIQFDDLEDYAHALREIRNNLIVFNKSEVGPLLPFGDIISGIETGRQSLGGALGINNTHSPLRIKYIQKLRKRLGEVLEQMEEVQKMKDFTTLPP